MKIHYKIGTRTNLTACGYTHVINCSCTIDTELVTCGSCKLTHAFANNKKRETMKKINRAGRLIKFLDKRESELSGDDLSYFSKEMNKI